MRKLNRLTLTLALLLTAVGGAWAQSANPEVIELKPDETGKKWILADMPASNIELQVEYYAESNLFLSKDALKDKANIAVKAGELGVEFGNDGKSAKTVTEGTEMTVTYNGTKKVLGMNVAKVLTITVAKGSTDLSGDKLLYYTPGETYRQAIANHPENKLDGDLGWKIWESGNDATIFYKESAKKARDLSIDGDQHFRPTDSINLDTVIDPTLNFYFVAQF